jgi:hypothetical protein
MVMAAAWWLRPHHEPMVMSPTTASREAVPSAPPSPLASPTPEPTPRLAAVAQARTRTRNRPTDTVDPFVPPLPPPEPIAIAALEAPDIKVTSLVLKPLVVPHVVVEPLDEPEHERKE